MNKICVYAICKNESAFVTKWLDSMQEADYIVVLDTGSTDNTLELLKSDPRITRVEQQIITPWRFDVARNESMKLIPDDANILVCTDLDEVFQPGWAEIVRNNWKEDTNRMFYYYAWSHNEVGEPTDVFKYDKIHDRNFHWVYPVHEVLLPIDPQFMQSGVDLGESVQLHHYPDNSKSRSSYFDLLKLSAEENPEDSHVNMLLAREYLVRGEYQTSLDHYLEVLKMADVNLPHKKLVLLECLEKAAEIYMLLKNYDEALWYAAEFIKEDYTYREPYFLMGEIYNDMKMYSLAEASVKAGLEYGTRKYTWVEKADTWISQANDILSISCYHLGKLDEAIANVEEAIKHHPSDIRLYKNYSVFLKNKIKTLKKIDE